jgi:phosphatidylglycerophosphatase A
MNFRQTAVLFLATGCHIGRIPIAPGTFGSLFALLPCFLLSRLPWWAEMVFIVVFSGFAVFVAGAAEKLLSSKDPGSIVIDEIAGMMVTLAGLPFNGVAVVSGFIIFRILDITKPFPIRAIERRLNGGTGVVMDDLVAGVMGNILLRIILSLSGNNPL